ncbi:helicase-exonuclease AddAB subunit AddA [Desulfosporosinus sp. PR]|uniref:helicase-exonuclease AddAB subunit AddA n=1 Tax=Candidatus Desulfosporosinus nitrosoreducens TaxID=3401928 RepID=UPI0027F4DC63|nr:helicase-exonuclease AddAB subunit AddA [Desulfosporosinus sp. PR]MDQ7093434.1 helicase-exonuclease AddAB subunit AddA [Desulfosporosinus sp. PR]
MSKTLWTSEQRAAITLRGQLLVAAAAGSGKTAVLVERIIQQITDAEKPAAVDRFLVVTFTKAAANEMRERIGKAIDEALFLEHDLQALEHLLQQRTLLQSANITTLHSFCLELIRKYFYQLELDPAFRVADQAEITLLRQDVVEDLFETRYEQGDPDFIRLIDAFGSDRDDQVVMEQTLRLFEFAQSQPNPAEWLKNLAQAYLWDSPEALMQSEWGQTVRQGFADSVTECLSLLENAEQIAQQPEGPAQYAETLQDDLNRLRLLSRILTSGTWEQIENQYQEAITFPKLAATRGKADKSLQEECKKLRDEAKKKLNALNEELFVYPLDQQVQALRGMGKLAETIASLVLEFAQSYARAKRQRNVLDFSDLEHFALRLLVQEEGPTLIAQGLQEYFTEVLVDEYQDINPVQERILQLVSRQEDSANFFMVGDVKQSIYRFRMADPGLFLAKYHNLPHWNSAKQAELSASADLVIDLNRNFRSRREIVSGVNFLFRQIMTEESGEISYDDQAALQYGASFVSGQDLIRTAEGPIEVHLIDLKEIKNSLTTQPLGNAPSSEDDLSAAHEEMSAEEFDKARVEARFVRERIQALVKNSEFQIHDKKLGNFRPVRYSDIVILMRSYSAVAPIYVEEFQAAGVPVYAETTSGYFGASEVETMLSLLKVIDNPHLDIPLAGVLRSPLVGLNGSELGKLRMMLPEGDFYEALALAVWAGFEDEKLSPEASGTFGRMLTLYEDSLAAKREKARGLLATTPGLKEKLITFWHNLETWRTRSRHTSLADLLWSLYEESGYLAYVGTLPAGVQRQANLRVLYDRAKRYEATRYRGLFRFLRFLERFQGQGNDLGNARALGENEDVVRLITVHASKGLEFPVVFVVGLGRAFNTQGLRGKMLLHARLGLGMPIIDVENNVRYPSLIQYAVQQRLSQETLAEELRILYVALTRAKERLFLYGNVENLENTLLKWRRSSDWQDIALPAGQLRSAKSFLDWIGPALIRHPLFNPEETSGLSAATLPENDSSWEIVCHRSFTAAEEANLGGELESSQAEDNRDILLTEDSAATISSEQWYAEIDRRLSWQYPHLVNQAAKTSVSELKRRHTWYVPEDTAQHPAIRSQSDLSVRPKFMQSAQPLTASERGSAMHTVMQHLPLPEWGKVWSTLTSSNQLNTIQEVLSNFEKREILSSEQRSVIQPAQIIQLLNSSAGQRLLQADQLLREVPFTLTFPPQKEASTNILIQGVIDVVMIFQKEEGVWAEILDYKTDSLSQGREDSEQLLRDRYALQLTLYALAIERLLGIRVTQCSLYSFALGREIIVPSELRLEIRRSLENQLFL